MKFYKPQIRFGIFVIFISIFYTINPVFAEYAWNVEIQIPDYDPLWEAFKPMWKNHWGG